MASETPESPQGLYVEVDHPDRQADVERITSAVERAATHVGFGIRYLAIVLTDGETVHALNREHLDHDYPTDVLSFPLDESAVESRQIDGEVYVDLDMAAEHAPEFGASFDDEVVRYAVHGVLHLMGFDDATDEQRDRMRLLEDRFVGDS